MTQQEEAPAPISKTQRKKAMEALQLLGEALVELSSDRVKKLDLPDALQDAVFDAQAMVKQNEGRRRQMQYIGRLMRGVEVEPIRAALATVRGENAGEVAKMHRIERLRVSLLDDEKVVQEIVSRYPEIDIQHLRSLRRAAIKERDQNKPPKNFRAIFQLLKASEDALENALGENAPRAEGL